MFDFEDLNYLAKELLQELIDVGATGRSPLPILKIATHMSEYE